MPVITPPFTVPPGQTCVFVLPTTPSGSGSSSGGCIGGTSWAANGVATVNGGSINLAGNCIAGPGQVVFAQWAGFKVPAWPYGTVIHAIYPILYVDSVEYGPAADMWMVINGSGFIGSPTLYSTGQVSVAHSGDSMGNTEAALTSATLGMTIDDTGLNEASGGDSVVATFAGLAVYATLGSASNSPSVWINVGNTKPLGS